MENIKQAEGLLREASTYMGVIERLNFRDPNMLKNCQQAIEIYTRAIFKIMDMEFPYKYDQIASFTKQTAKEKLNEEVRKLRDKDFPILFPYKDQVPRIVFLAFFWSAFREYAETTAKDSNVPLNSIFGKEEAKLALEHAKFCYKLLKSLIDLKR